MLLLIKYESCEGMNFATEMHMIQSKFALKDFSFGKFCVKKSLAKSVERMLFSEKKSEDFFLLKEISKKWPNVSLTALLIENV